MKQTIRTVTVTAAILAALAMNSMASPRGPMDVPGPGVPNARHLMKQLEELGLTQDQKQQVKAILKNNAPLIQPQVRQFVTERRQLRALIQADQIDETAIRAQSAKIAALEADLAINRAHVSQQIRTVLTPEQRLKAQDLSKQADARADRFMQRGFPQIDSE